MSAPMATPFLLAKTGRVQCAAACGQLWKDVPHETVTIARIKGKVIPMKCPLFLFASPLTAVNKGLAFQEIYFPGYLECTLFTFKPIEPINLTGKVPKWGLTPTTRKASSEQHAAYTRRRCSLTAPLRNSCPLDNCSLVPCAQTGFLSFPFISSS